MVTIYDVAKLAGVSPATVSRVFNGIKVTPDRVEAVKRAAEELGFVPNRNARRLRTSSSEFIAMMLPDIENPFYSVMTRAVEDVARAAGYSVMLCNTYEDAAREQEYLRIAVSDPVAGIIVTPTRTTDLSLPLERGVPVVCVDRRAPDGAADSVVADNLAGAKAATQLLLDAGYRRVACVTGPQRIETAVERLEGYREALREFLGVNPPTELIYQMEYTVAGGEEATRALLSLPEPPDAVFAANNKLASGVIRVLSDADLLPPKTGVVSFGGLPMVLLAPRGIMVTHLPTRALGTTAAQMLLERIQGLTVPPREVVLPVVIGDEESGIAVIEGASAG